MVPALRDYRIGVVLVVKKIVTCRVCGVEFLAYPPTKFCPMHRRERNNAAKREYREDLKAHGICINCGQRDAVEGRTRCEVCREKEKKYRQKKGA